MLFEYSKDKIKTLKYIQFVYLIVVLSSGLPLSFLEKSIIPFAFLSLFFTAYLVIYNLFLNSYKLVSESRKIEVDLNENIFILTKGNERIEFKFEDISRIELYRPVNGSGIDFESQYFVVYSNDLAQFVITTLVIPFDEMNKLLRHPDLVKNIDVEIKTGFTHIRSRFKKL